MLLFSALIGTTARNILRDPFYKALQLFTNCELDAIFGRTVSIKLYRKLWRQPGAGPYMEPLPLRSSVFGTGRFSASYQKRNRSTNLGTKSLIYNVVHARYAMEWWHKNWGSNQPIQNLYLTLLG